MPRRRRPPPSKSMQLVPYDGDRHLSSPFKLPRGWRVREVPRADGSRFDTYYHEPETGRQFRSIKEIQRYLNGEPNPQPCRATRRSNHSCGYAKNWEVVLSAQRNPGCRRMLVSGGKLVMLDDDVSPKQMALMASDEADLMAPDVLPDGWVVEEVPRKYNCSWVDRYYYEPGSGLKFRSLVAVERYLAESEDNVPLSQALEEIKENKPLAKVFKLEDRFKNCISKKKNISKANTEDSSFIGPPMKVNWVLFNSRDDTWNAFISDTSVPDSVKKQWSDRFVIFMNDDVGNCQDSEA